jgi:hypothetical protein
MKEQELQSNIYILHIICSYPAGSGYIKLSYFFIRLDFMTIHNFLKDSITRFIQYINGEPLVTICVRTAALYLPIQNFPTIPAAIQIAKNVSNLQESLMN